MHQAKLWLAGLRFRYVKCAQFLYFSPSFSIHTSSQIHSIVTQAPFFGICSVISYTHASELLFAAQHWFHLFLFSFFFVDWQKWEASVVYLYKYPYNPTYLSFSGYLSLHIIVPLWPCLQAICFLKPNYVCEGNKDGTWRMKISLSLIAYFTQCSLAPQVTTLLPEWALGMKKYSPDPGCWKQYNWNPNAN